MNISAIAKRVKDRILMSPSVVCAACLHGLHSHCEIQGCYCDCQLEDDSGDDEDVCPHGIGYDQECEDCDEEDA